MKPWLVDFPRESDVFQRRADGHADVPVQVFDPVQRRYRAELNGVGTVELSEHDGGLKRGVIKRVPAGDYRLVVHGEDVAKSFDRIGVGDVHGAIGQSHIAGRSWTLFRSTDGRTMDPTNVNDAPYNLGRDSFKIGGEHNPEGQALGSWMPLLADLLTERWEAPQKFLNYAVGGSHTSVWQEGATAFRRAVNSFENAGVRYVMVSIGATDAVEGATVAELRERMQKIVEALQVRGFTVLLGRMPFGLRAEWNQAMRRQQRAVAELWDEIPGLYRGGDLSLLDPEEHVNTTDGAHLNAVGYREAALLWARAYEAVPLPQASTRPEPPA